MNENTTNMKEGAAGGGSWWYWCEGATTSSNSNSSSGSGTEVCGNSVLAGHEEDLHEVMEYSGGWFRGIARALGSNRPLAFVSEGAVAGQRMMPKWLYYSAWGVSGVAIVVSVGLQACSLNTLAKSTFLAFAIKTLHAVLDFVDGLLLAVEAFDTN